MVKNKKATAASRKALKNTSAFPIYKARSRLRAMVVRHCFGGVLSVAIGGWLIEHGGLCHE